MKNKIKEILEFKDSFYGEVLIDSVSKSIYATDASAYQEKPLAVTVPKNKEEIKKIIQFANKHKIALIPRTAGTSLAGQVVGNGIVVDCSKYLTKIIEINLTEKWVRVEPGVVLDELNLILKEHGLFFGPETSTSNRCMVGGMVGNNSCGAHSLIYGSTRDHTLEVQGYLSDGSEVSFGKLSKKEFENKCKSPGLEGRIYGDIKIILDNPENRERIKKEFPDPEIKRRNTGYAIDLLMDSEPFSESGEPFNFCKLICGSEGTLFFVTEIKLNLVDLPPAEKGLLVVHHYSVGEALKANLVALKYNPGAIELFDHYILECTKSSIEHRRNRFFLKGDPGALLCVEFARDTKEEIHKITGALTEELKKAGFGYEYPVLYDGDIAKVWALRKAGLGLLSNIPGDSKPQPVIEDTAVTPQALPAYIAEFNNVLSEMKLNCVFYAHIATGELHLRPVINLKTEEGITQFRKVAEEIARLVKKYRGSLSGEHGDGRLRGEFIPQMIGERNYELLRRIKKTWDPDHLLNPGKITDTPSMDTFLRYTPGLKYQEYDTVFDFSESLGFLRMAEKCNGSADCRKSAVIGGTMCPSYQASFNESWTTRARSNLLRQILSEGNEGNEGNPFNNKDLYDILDLCLSCKGCKSECPSGVDMAKLKAEFLFQYYKSNRIPLRTYLIANFSILQALASKINFIYNSAISSRLISGLIKKVIGFATERTLPKVYRITFRGWLRQHLSELNSNLSDESEEVILFVDEFTNFNDVPVGIKAVKLLNRLGYRILVLKNKDSGRPYLSKGFLKKAKKLAKQNIELYSSYVHAKRPLIGIEPSAILTFRDEYPDLLRGTEKDQAKALAKNTFTLEEFLAKESTEERIDRELFSKEHRNVLFHGHCQQKAISTTQAIKTALSIPENYAVEEIKSGCCGMAGSFGYEKEHFDLSGKIGELVLFPEIRNAGEETLLVASGTSCRHHIKDGTKKSVQHPVELLYDALV